MHVTGFTGFPYETISKTGMVVYDYLLNIIHLPDPTTTLLLQNGRQVPPKTYPTIFLLTTHTNNSHLKNYF